MADIIDLRARRPASRRLDLLTVYATAGPLSVVLASPTDDRGTLTLILAGLGPPEDICLLAEFGNGEDDRIAADKAGTAVVSALTLVCGWMSPDPEISA